MIKLLTIIGARPQIIKSSAISRCINEKFSTLVEEVIIHTGQHYDENMSGVFFEEMGIPKPQVNLNVGSGSHGVQTAKMLEGVERVLQIKKPDYLLIYGDTNSTIAGALAAVKLHIPVVHVEAGLRSYNKAMPEEVNRILSDHISTFLFAPTDTALKNLQQEGFNLNVSPEEASADRPCVTNIGDVMMDNALFFGDLAEQHIRLSHFGLTKDNYVLATIHRDLNTDDVDKLETIFEGLLEISKDIPVYCPLHPRTAGKIGGLKAHNRIQSQNNLRIVDPVGYLEMLSLEKNAAFVITDSGGVQKEAYFFRKPTLIIRPETEWVEILETSYALLCQPENMLAEFNKLRASQIRKWDEDIFGDGHAADRIISFLLEHAANNAKKRA